MSAKHTPGPWPIDTYRPGDKALFISDAGVTIDIDDCTVAERAERFANADLISAAPELLEALAGIVKYCSLDIPLWRVEQARVAIAKATGKESV